MLELKMLIDEKFIEIVGIGVLFRDRSLHDGIFNALWNSFRIGLLLFFSDSIFSKCNLSVVKSASYTISMMLFTLIQSWIHETSQTVADII